jgi:phage gp37-like protein
MIEEAQDAIITELDDISAVNTVGVWQGEIESLIRTPQRLPALHVIYQGADFEEIKTAGADTPGHAMDFMIVLVAKNAKSREAGASACYAVIEAVRTKLIGLRIHGDLLWPVKEDLLFAEGGILVYGLNYRLGNLLVE